jgi:hypothetical protein
MEWTPDVAKDFMTKCGFLLLLDSPQGLEFGLDYNPCYTTGPLFKGVKLIPPGIHFMYYQYASILSFHNIRVPNKEGGNGGPRKSSFFVLESQQV